jgi:hypothetical protein
MEEEEAGGGEIQSVVRLSEQGKREEEKIFLREKP